MTMRLACVIPTLRQGGAERVLARLTEGLAARGFEAAIICLQPPSEAPFFPISDQAALYRLDAISDEGSISWARAIGQLRHVRKELAPDVVLAFTTVGGLLAAATHGRGQPAPLVISERTDPGAHGKRIGWGRRMLRDWSHVRADALVVQTEQARRGLTALARRRASVIGNPVAMPDIAARPGDPSVFGRFRLVAAGRLVEDKGFDRLLAAFATLAPRFATWDLAIHGDGPLRATLLDQVTRLGLAGRVDLPGTSADLSQELCLANLLVLPSRMEGFANVLGEASATGLPVVAYAGLGGVDELIVDGSTGLLADPDDPVNSLAQALAQLMDDAPLRVQFGAAGRLHAATFSDDIHNEAWAALLTRVVAEKSAGRGNVRNHRSVESRRPIPARG